MKTQTEALKMALEALETYHGYMEPLLTVFGGPRVPAEKSTTYKVEKAITVIKEALAQQEGQSNYCLQCEALSRELAALKAQQSNEQVEPVAWIEHHKGGDNLNWEEVNHPYAKATPLYTHPPVPTAQPEQEPVAQYIGENWDGSIVQLYEDLEKGTKLYTTPPQRKPLTDAQLEKGRGQTFSINNPFCPCDSKTFRKVARWVEAAHDIKE